MPLFSISITLLNDSAYPLNAQIIDATGRYLALIHLVPGQMYIYSISQGAFQKNTDQPYTPLTVIFLCQEARPYDYSRPPTSVKGQKKQKPNKSQYINQFGIWTAVPRGALVNALGCPFGPKSCVVTKQPHIKSRIGSSASTNQGVDNWSNDGGQTWSNDSGFGLFNCQEGDATCTMGQSNLSGSSPGDMTKRFTNKGEIEVRNAYGEDWDQDRERKGETSVDNSNDNPHNTKKTNKTHSEMGFFSKDRNRVSTESKYTPTKSTPLPFTTSK